MTNLGFRAVLVQLVSLLVLYGHVHAAEPETDASGLEREPSCRIASSFFNGLTVLGKTEPTGIKARNDDWHMEIYARKDGASWTLVGKRRAPESGFAKLCRLASGNGAYEDQIWFKKFFLPHRGMSNSGQSPAALACASVRRQGILCDAYATAPKGASSDVKVFLNDVAADAILEFSREWESSQTIPVRRLYVNWHKREKSQSEIDAESLAMDFRVESVPTFVLGGKYRVSIDIGKINPTTLSELRVLLDALVTQ